MKIAGLLAVMSACLWIACRLIMTRRRELRLLEGLCWGLRSVREELAARLCPIEELLRLAGDRAGGEAGRFFRAAADDMTGLGEMCFSEIWKEACSALPDTERFLLVPLGATLGRYELSDQLSACDHCLGQLEQELKQLRSQLPEQRRLALALSAAAGLFLCLLIL